MIFGIALRHGTTRTVFLIGRYAIKLPAITEWRLFLMGLLGNMQERRFDRMRYPGLCPVLFGCPGGWFLIARRAHPLSWREFEELDYGKFIQGDQDLPKGEWILPVENKQSSFGILNGRIVAVDYGDAS